MGRTKRKKNNKKSNSSNHVIRSLRSHAYIPFKSGVVDVSNADMRPVTLSVRISGQHTGGAASNTTTISETDYQISTLGSRAVAFGDLFSYWRCVGLNYVARSSAALKMTSDLTLRGQNTWFVAFPLLPKSTFTAPTTIAQFVDFPHLNWNIDCGTIKVNIGRKELLSGMPYQWLKTTNTGSIPDDELIQFCHETANLTISAVDVSSILVEVITLDLEFAGAMDPALNPRVPSYLHPRLSFDFEETKK